MTADDPVVAAAPVPVPVPALLRAARSAYGAAVHRALAEGGFDDVPKNGSFVLGAIARGGAPLGDIIASLGVSKQSAGQLVDTLVLRGYLDRAVDPADRRRLVVSLTERGTAAAAAVRAAVDEVDEAFTARMGAGQLAQLRSALTVLASVGTGQSVGTGHA